MQSLQQTLYCWESTDCRRMYSASKYWRKCTLLPNEFDEYYQFSLSFSLMHSLIKTPQPQTFGAALAVKNETAQGRRQRFSEVNVACFPICTPKRFQIQTFVQRAVVPIHQWQKCFIRHSVSLCMYKSNVFVCFINGLMWLKKKRKSCWVVSKLLSRALSFRKVSKTLNKFI